jgi:predicted lipid-binding transport protein (Tim44 family)
VHIDILIFAIIAAFLIYRLNSVLGSRHGGERERPNPFASKTERQVDAGQPTAAVPLPKPVAPLAGFEAMIDMDANKDGRIETGLSDIAAADPYFDINTFMGGAKFAFEMIVTAYTKGDLETLKPLLSPKLYADFESGIAARNAAGHKSEVTIHRIKQARINEAHLGGTMAYVTIDYDVEETTVTRDSQGNVVDGNPDRIFSVEDIWTFTRDTRSNDPNWMLIETRAVEK